MQISKNKKEMKIRAKIIYLNILYKLVINKAASYIQIHT